MSELTRDESNELLREGIGSYADALVALEAFRHGAYTRCAQTVEKRLDDLGEAIGCKLSDEHLNLYKWDTSTEACISCKVRSPEMTRLEFYAGVDWTLDDKGDRCVFVDAGFWVPRKLEDTLKRTIKDTWEKKQLDLWQEEGIYLARQIDLADADSFEAKLAEIVEIWTSAGKKCGTFMRYLPQTFEA